MSKQHTPEPWIKAPKESRSEIIAESNDTNGGFVIAETCGPDKESNAIRIVACVNACAGITTSTLEAIATARLDSQGDEATNQLAKLSKERDELIAVLADIGSYTGEGRMNSAWQEIVKSMGEKARAAISNVKE